MTTIIEQHHSVVFTQGSLSTVIPIVRKCPKKSIMGFNLSITSPTLLVTRFLSKSPSFGKSYSTRNILTIVYCKIPSFDISYSTRNILTRFVRKSPSLNKSYSTRNILKKLNLGPPMSSGNPDFFLNLVTK